MTVKKCLDAKVSAGKITKEQADEAMKIIERFRKEHEIHAGPDGAEAIAAVMTAKELKEQATKAQQQAALTIMATYRNLGWSAKHKEGWYAGVSAIFARDIWGKAKHTNVEVRQKVVRAHLHSMFESGIDAFRTKMGGLKGSDIIGLQRFVRELYGEGTGDAAAGAHARDWTETTEYAVDRFNAAGGNIRNKKDWRLPQRTNQRVVAKDADGYRAFLYSAFAEGRLRIRDFETGLTASPKQAKQIIDGAVESIRTDGLADLTPGAVGGKKLANRRNDPRAFEWTSADAWLEHNNKWGDGDAGIYGLLTDHMEGMARDIGLLEVLGPNPDHMARVLIDTARKNGVGHFKAYSLQAIYDQVSGRSRIPVSELLANWANGVRAWLTSAQLGSAPISSVTDFATMQATSLWNAIPPTKVMSRYFSIMNPANAAERKAMVRSGLIADGWTRIAQSAHREQADVVGPGLPGKIADFVMRASGLAAHTEAGRWAFGKEFQGMMADHAGKSFSKLPDELKRTFETYGVTEKDWNIAREHGVLKEEGIAFLDPAYLARQGGEKFQAGTKIHEAILTEMDFAIPMPGARERAILVGQTRPGTLVGEMVRFGTQYKTFPVTMMTTHLMRGLSSIQAGDRGAYLAGTALGMTVMGAFALQIKEVIKGKDPKNMLDGKFWAAAFVQGGGAGIVGDFLYSGVSRTGKDWFSTLVGPGAALADDVRLLTLGNIGELGRDENTNMGRELTRFLRSYTPGSNLWYSRLAVDRMMWDQLQTLIDPQYPQAFARMRSRALKESNQDFYWKPGQALPDRGPQLTQ